MIAAAGQLGADRKAGKDALRAHGRFGLAEPGMRSQVRGRSAGSTAPRRPPPNNAGVSRDGGEHHASGAPPNSVGIKK